MNFPHAIALIISGPFLLAVSHGGVSPNDVIVTLIFIRVNSGLSLGKLMDLPFKGGSGRPSTHSAWFVEILALFRLAPGKWDTVSLADENGSISSPHFPHSLTTLGSEIPVGPPFFFAFGYSTMICTFSTDEPLFLFVVIRANLWIQIFWPIGQAVNF